MADFTLIVGVDTTVSYENMRKEINAIVRLINKTPQKIKVQFDEASVKTMRSQITEVYKSVGKEASSASSSVKKMGSAISSAAASAKQAKATNEQQASSYRDATRAIKEYYSILLQLSKTKNDVKLTDKGWVSESGNWDNLANALNRTKTAFDMLTSSENISKMTSEEQISLLRLMASESEKYGLSIEATANKESEAARKAEEAQRKRAEAEREAASAKKESEQRTVDDTSALRAHATILSQGERALANWSAAENSRNASSREAYSNLKLETDALREARSAYKNGTITLEELRQKTEHYRLTLKDTENTLRANGDATKSLGDRLGGLASKFGAWLSVSQLIMYAVRSVRQMVRASIELDSAMTQMQIVTKASNDEMQKFGDTAAKAAQRVGASISDFVSSATVFARLGYDTNESSILAEYTTMLQNVGDIDVQDAQNAMTAIIKAYNVDVKDIESIMDKLVAVGNNFPISVSQIAEGMNNASSTLHAAGNTFEQSVALLTAANTTVQNAAKASTGLRTIAARLRNTKTELDDLGEAMTEATYAELVSALTDANVALTDANGEFRSTYDIMADIARVWDTLSSTAQAGLATTISGTRQQAIFYSIIEQFKEASGAMDEMANSAGALDEAYATFMQSTQAHINQFKAAFESLSSSTFTTSFLNNVIDIGTGLLGVVESIMKIIDALGGLNTVLPITIALIAALNITSIIASIKKLALTIFNSNLVKGIQAIHAGLVYLKTGSQAASSAFYMLGGAASVATVALTAFVAIIGIAFIAYQKWQQAQQEARDKAIEAAKSADDLSDEIGTLVDRYIDLSEAVKTDSSAKEDLISVQDELVKKLDIEKGRLEDLVKEYGNLSDAIKAASVEALQDSERDLRGGLNAYEEELLKKAGAHGVAGFSMNHMTATWSKSDAETNRAGLQALVDAGYISSGSFGTGGMELYLTGDGYDLSTVEGVINAHQRLAEMLDIVQDKVGSNNEVYKSLYEEYNRVSDALKNYQDSIGSLNTNLAEQYMLQGLIGKAIPSTTDEYNTYRQSVIDAAIASGEFVGSEDDIVAAVDAVLSQQSRFADFATTTTNAMNSGSAAASTYKANLEGLKETVSALKSAYDVLEKAEEEMASEAGALSVDTINALAAADENYLDYLYEENGLIKLNTEAWKENANAKMKAQMAEIQKEIDALEAQNAKLQEQRDLYVEMYFLSGDIWTKQQIDSFNSQISENTKLIAANQGKLAVYGALFNSITDSATEAFNVYQNALDNFANIADSINDVSSAMQTLADLQDEVSDGFAISLEKALEFAAVYPEILNNATVTAEGEILLNETVVNDFIAGKEAELRNAIDAQIQELESKKAVLEAQMEFSQAELDMAKQVGEGEADITKEVAEYRLDTANQLVAALIQAGVDEATAFQLAAAAMAGNAEEFDRIAAEVCTDVNGNFNSAAYAAAQAIYQNMNSAKRDVASLATQAHQTAQAIAAMAEGVQAGSSAIVGGSGGGSGGYNAEITLGGANFVGTDYTYEAKTLGLDEFISDLELDIASYQDAIAQINGQIAALEAIKNMPLERFRGSGIDKSTGGGGTNTDTDKEIEEYIADIDEYYEALKRLESIEIRLSDLQSRIEYADTDEEKILLTKELIDLYGEQADAMEHLNSLRSDTITKGVAELQALGFEVKYNAETNEFYIENLEHLNELQATSVGEYGSLQEATNALRKETEEFINTMNDLNSSNQEGADSLRKLKQEIKAANQEVIDYLKGIVEKANDVVDVYQNVYDTLHAAADEFASSGFITIDTLQSLLGLGAQYMQYLMDENGALVINHERIDAVLAAKTQELALEEALTYVERLRLAMQADSVEDLNNLLYATTEATDATWGLVYANLALLGLDDEQYQAALHNINAIRSLADSAVTSIGRVAGETTEQLNTMKSGLNDILNYVMDMLKYRVNEQIKALQNMKDAFANIISLRKEALNDAKKEADYQKNVAKRTQEIAKLQAKINALALDDSREAKAQRAKLEEELAALQEELADDQADHAREAQEDALDDMQKAYEDEKDDEIRALEESISSTEKLYQMAIEYIRENWSTLKDELIQWNYEVGTNFQSDIESAWEAALAAAQRYGDYVTALSSIDADIGAAGGGTHHDVVYDDGYTAEEAIHAIIKEMWANSQAWSSADTDTRDKLNKRNLELGAKLATYGINAVRGSDGVWYVGSVGGEKLYEKYKQYLYHSGGIAGDRPTLKQNEVMAVLKKGEPVLDEKREQGLYRILDFVQMLSDKMGMILKPGDIGRRYFGGGDMITPVRDLINGGSNSEYAFSPVVNVNISHSGTLSENDARRYGKIAADSALQELEDAFSKRGITTLGNAALK